jgi:hypothetical protein
MSETLINLIIQLVAGLIGGNAAGAALKDYDLGKLGNTIAGAIGGVGGGQILQAIIPALAATGGGDVGVSARTSRGWRRRRRNCHVPGRCREEHDGRPAGKVRCMAAPTLSVKNRQVGRDSP